MLITPVTWIKLPATTSPAESIKFSGKVELKQSFGEEECSARLNYAPWTYVPVKNTQVKIGSDGTVEFSGIVILDKVKTMASILGYSEAEVQKAFEAARFIKVNPPIYFKGKPVIKNNQLTINAQTLEIGHFQVPLDKFNVEDSLSNIAEDIFDEVPNFEAKSVTFKDGEMTFDGTVPAKQEVVMKD